MDHVLSFKVVFTGDSGCGKSSIIKRYDSNCKNSDEFIFNKYETSTIGVDYISIKKDYILDDNKNCKIKLSIWDTGGQERFKSICKAYYKDIAAAIIVFDMNNYDSFLNIINWIKEIQRININDRLVYIILGNKSDLIKESEETNYRNECKLILGQFNIDYIFYETSVKYNSNINECFNELTEILFNTFISKYSINKTIKDIEKIQIDNFSEKNNGINVFKVNIDPSNNSRYRYNRCNRC